MADRPTIGTLRRQMAAALATAGAGTPDLDARLLLAHALGAAPPDLVARAGDAVTQEEEAAARALLERRLAGEPVGRIRGHRAFWTLDLLLSPETLEPRPDTETVVEEALALVPDKEAPLRILDLGTGTGAILAALLVERPNAFGVGVDRSEGAARTARENLARAGLGGRGAVLVGEWGTALSGGFDLVVSNPPYITIADMAALAPDVRDHDPALALVAGADGLDAYRAIAADLPRLMKPGGHAVLELGIGQEACVAALLRENGLAVPRPARHDLGGVPRALGATRP